MRIRRGVFTTICNEGAHGVEVGFRIDFIRQAEKLARWVQAQP
jgi:hypothetical protein